MRMTRLYEEVDDSPRLLVSAAGNSQTHTCASVEEDEVQHMFSTSIRHRIHGPRQGNFASADSDCTSPSLRGVHVNQLPVKFNMGLISSSASGILVIVNGAFTMELP
ncbi:hypothetical protein BU15DRAFT_65152 [Melanogaster broomeanus]|nr:hypothetical protein BU15DRAFT_65152 [Melanogaster broomeanus]